MEKGSTVYSFTYDVVGRPVAITEGNTRYFYVLNQQGDVVAIINGNGDFVVEYYYDAWGRLISTSGTMSSTLGANNPLRYRGYVYDTETGLYYLQSRYYNPTWGRFINADDPGYMGIDGTPSSYNLFSYCGNNPVTRADYGGGFWDAILDLFSLGKSIFEVCKNPTDGWAWVGLAGDALDLVPIVTGLGEMIRGAKTVGRVTDTVQIAKAAECSTNAIGVVKNAKRIHGNSLKTTKETVGYALRKTDTGEIMKFGETTRGVKRYTNKFYIENGVYMDIMARGSKYDMHLWQHDQIIEYTQKRGTRPPWNKTNW